MNTQEMRRLGLLPYEEDEVRATWHSGVIRQIPVPRPIERVPLPEMVLEHTELNMPSRRIVNGRVERVSDDALVEDMNRANETVQEPIVMPVIEPIEVPEETVAQSAWRNFIERFRN